MAPGAKFSTMTSARFTMFLTRSSPRSDLRLTVMDFLLALNNRKYQESRFWLWPGPDCRPNKERPASPPCGFSTLTTSAPSQASASVQDGPASNWVRSRTRTPARKAGNPPFVAIFSSSPQRHRLCQMVDVFGQSKRTACSDDLNSKYIIFVASMNVGVSLVAAKSRLFTRSPRRQAREVAKRSSTFDAFFFEAPNKRDHLTLFGLGHLELRQGRGGMTKEHVPVAIANPHASVRESHVPAAIVHWSTRARAKKIDEKLLFAHDAVFSAVRPEPPELRIGSEPGQKIIRHCCDCAISTKAFVKGLRPVAHCVLKSVAGRATPAGVVIPSRVYRYRNSGAQPVIGDVSDEKT